MKIRVCGQDVEVSYYEPMDWSSTAMGRSSTQQGRITINTGMPVTIQDSTLIHEVLHYIADTNCIKLDEHVVAVLANGVHAFMRDNQDVIKKLIGDE